MEKFSLIKNVKIESSFSNDGKHYFFGYYDKCPWSGNGKFILAHGANFLNHLPTGNNFAGIYLIDSQNKEIRELSKTFAWNWQQGAMLQWLGPDFNEKLIFNDLRNGKFISVIYNIKNQQEKIIDFPVYAVHPSGKSALSLNFSRLDRLRGGYGYKGLDCQNQNEAAPDDDGIYSIDLENGTAKILLSFSDLRNFKNPMPENKWGRHWVEHMMFNPSGSRFVFIHRFQLESDRMYSRLFTADFNGANLNILLNTGMASHFSWKNNEQVLAWGRMPTILSGIEKKGGVMKLLLPFYKKLNITKGLFRRKFIGDNLLLLTDRLKKLEKIGEKILDDDGHCSFSPDGKWILTDTYPDKNRYRTLILYNLEKNKRIDIGKFYSIPDKKYNIGKDWEISGMRCDLHPRWNRDGTKICIDSVHEGSRNIYVLDVSAIVKSF